MSYGKVIRKFRHPNQPAFQMYKSGMRIIALTCLLCCFTPIHAGPGDWLDFLRDVGNNITRKLFEKPEKQAADLPEPVLPSDLPEHWRAEFLREPVFDSKMLVIEAGNPDAEKVLLVHGQMQIGSRIWYDTISLLEKEYHIVALDLPGFGASQAPAGRYTPANYAAILSWLIQEKFHDEAAIVVGHSLGGAVTLMFGAHYPDQLKHAVLVDAAGILHRAATVKHLSTPPALPESIPGSETIDALGLLILGDTVGRIAEALPDPTPLLYENDAMWNLTIQGNPKMNAAYSLIETNFTGEIKYFPAPVTVIWGDDDPISPLRTGKLLANRLPNAELKVIPGGQHTPMRTQAELFNTFLLQSLRHPPKAGRKPAAAPNKHNLVCRNNKNEIYSGHYNTVLIENCRNITLQTISASKLVIIDSIVQMENVSIRGGQTACSFESSTVLATGLVCHGDTGLYADQGRIDLAGADIHGNSRGIQVAGKTYFVISVSELGSPLYSGDLHNAFTLNDQALEELMSEEPPSPERADD